MSNLKMKTISETATICDFIQAEKSNTLYFPSPNPHSNKMCSSAKKKKEMKTVKKELEKIISRNEELQKQVKELLEQERKWNEEIFATVYSQNDYLQIMSKNDNLREKIVKLEMETKQEVHHLCQKVLTIKAERDKFAEQVDVLKEENQSLQKKWEKTNEECKGVISVQTYVKEIKHLQTSQKELVDKYENELKTLRDKCKEIENDKNVDAVEVKLLKEEIRVLLKEKSELENSKKEIQEESRQQSKLLEELVNKDHENYEIMLSMKTMIRNLTDDKDVLSQKCNYQESVQQELHTLFLTQIHNLGHLEEKIWTTKEQMIYNMGDMNSKAQQLEESFIVTRLTYEAQIEELRQKISEQNLVINDLNVEKQKLKTDFENLQQAILVNQTFSSQLRKNQMLHSFLNEDQDEEK